MMPETEVSNEDKKKKAKKSGPDSAEGWRMVAACFATTFLLGGSTRSAAVLYVAVMDTFGVQRGVAAWPISLISGFVNFAGILSGPLSQKLGLRTTCVIGGSMSFICLFACFFATSIPYLTVFFGILNGIGIGLMYNLNPVILSHYFKEYKGLALGINYCGSTVAAMCFPKLMELLYNSFGLRGLFLIYAGIMLNTPVISFMMKRPSWSKRRMKAHDVGREFIRRMTISSVRDSRAASQAVRSRAGTIRESRANTVSRSRADTMRSQSGSAIGGLKSRRTSISVAGVAIGGNKAGIDIIMATDIGIGTIHNVDHDEEEDTSHLDNISIREINQPQHPQELPTIDATVATQDANFSEEELDEALKQLSLREIFCNPLFYLLIVSYLIFTTYTDILLTVMVDLFEDKGIAQSTAIATIPLVSITDMTGRIALPFLADKKLVDRKMMFACNFFCLGILAWIIPSAWGYGQLTALFLLIGWFYGSTVVMCTVIVSDLLGVHNLAVANGLICSSVGFIAFGRPAFIGFFRDTVGSYGPMLYFWGTLCLIMGCVWTLVLIILRKREKSQ